MKALAFVAALALAGCTNPEPYGARPHERAGKPQQRVTKPAKASTEPALEVIHDDVRGVTCYWKHNRMRDVAGLSCVPDSQLTIRLESPEPENTP
jgi:hypothetical protein